MKQFSAVLLLALLCSGCLVGDVWGMGMSAGDFELNLDDLQVGIFQDFDSGESLKGVSIPVIERIMEGVPLALSVAGIQANEGSGLSEMKLGGIVSVDGKSLAERLGWTYKLPENIDIGLFVSYAKEQERFGLYFSLKL